MDRETAVRVTGKPKYERPTVIVMNETEVLKAFQMTAAKISAAGCWWTGCVPTA